MTSVLLVDDEGPVRKALKRALRLQGYDTADADGYEQAVQCMKGRPFDVLVTDLRMGGKDGLKLIESTHKSWPATKPILMSAYASAVESQRAAELGAIRTLCKPFSNEDLVEAVRQAVDCSDGFVGTVHGLSLIDMLQMFHYGQRSVTVHVLGVPAGRVSLDRGQIVSAQLAEQTGEAALQAILSQPAGALRTAPLGTCKPNISRPFQALLLDHLRRLDEKERDRRESEFGRSSLPGALTTRPPTPPLGGRRESSARPLAGGDTPQLREEAEKARAGLEQACSSVVEHVIGAIACAVVELSNGSLLGASDLSQYGDQAASALSAATRELFRGAAITQLEEVLLNRENKAAPAEQFVQEVQMSTSGTLHFGKVLAGGKVAVALVTTRSTNVAMGWVQLRSMLPVLEAELHRLGMLE